MLRGIALASLLAVASLPGFAATWIGFLVNSSCFQDMQGNRNPRNTDWYVNTDVNYEIRYCTPSAKTKSFGFVDGDGLFYKLDAASSAQAAELVKRMGKLHELPVTVTGRVTKDTMHLQSVALRQNR